MKIVLIKRVMNNHHAMWTEEKNKKYYWEAKMLSQFTRYGQSLKYSPKKEFRGSRISFLKKRVSPSGLQKIEYDESQFMKNDRYRNYLTRAKKQSFLLN